MSKLNLSPINNLQNEATVTATINNNNTLITAAIENSISRDGTLPNHMNSRLDMNSNQIINLPDATTDQEPVTYGQYIDGITSVNNGVVVDGDFVVLQHNDTMLNDRVLTAGKNLDLIDTGAKGTVEIRVKDEELNALSDVVSDVDKLPYFTGSGTADVTDFTAYARTLVDDVDATTARATLGLVIDTDVQPHDPTLNSLVSAGNGIMTKTAADTITPRTIVAPANGISMTDGDGVAGNPTMALTNDLAAIEGLATTGLIARTATDTATTRTVTGTANEITVTNGSGVSGDPTVSLPSALTFTGKTVTGGSFTSPAITTPTGIVKGDVGLGNVDNTSDATKNAAVATLTNKTLTSPVINTPTGIVKGDVGLGNVDNTSDATKDAASTTLTNKTISGSANTLSNIANASLSSVSDSTIKSNISGSSASPSDNTITAVLDKQLGTTRGTIAYRGATTWDALTPGTSGNFLKTSGTGTDPSWAAIPGGGDLLSTNNLSDLTDVVTARDNLKIQKKNYIINGSMMVSQENGSTAGTSSSYYPVDQFFIGASSSGSFSIAQVASLSPEGSPNRLRVTVTSADASVAAGDNVYLSTRLEGLRVADLKYGTASAKTTTLQFGCKAPAGTYCVAFGNSANNRSYVAEYVISGGEANTDVIKSVTIPGDTSGTWLSTTGTGIEVRWGLMVGSTYQQAAGSWGAMFAEGSSNQFNFMGTNSNVFELFDVGLYEGSAAPDFKVSGYAEELRLCQRYYYKMSGVTTCLGSGLVYSSTLAVCLVPFPVSMRSSPSLTVSNLQVLSTGLASSVSSAINGGSTGIVDAMRVDATSSGMTAGSGAILQSSGSGGYIVLNARM